MSPVNQNINTMHRRTLFAFWLISLFNMALPLDTFANEFHYNNILIGDRGAGFGGAYVAIADDPTGLYYNPAGIVYSPSSQFSASMNAYHVTETTYKNVFKEATGDKDWVRNSKVLIPNYFGLIQPLGSGTFGFSYAVIDASQENQDQTFLQPPEIIDNFTNLTLNFNNQDTSYLFGPSYAQEVIKQHLSIGMTLYGYYRSQESAFNQMFQVNEVDKDKQVTIKTFHWKNAYSQIEEYGIRPTIGIIFSPIKPLSLGLTIAKTYLLNANSTFQQSCATGRFVETDICQRNQLNTQQVTSDVKRKFPLTINAGTAFFINNRWIVASSVWLYESINKNTNRPIWNAAIGTEYYLWNSFAIRLGAYTNNANTPDLKAGRLAQDAHVDLYGMSLSLSTFTRTTALTAGVSTSSGTGQAQIIPERADFQVVEMFATTVFLSASYSM